MKIAYGIFAFAGTALSLWLVGILVFESPFDTFSEQGGLLMENYMVNRAKFAGTPFFPTDEAVMVTRYEQIIPKERDLIRRSSRVAGLKVVFGSDAVAGMHGRNAEEFIHRVRDGGADAIEDRTLAMGGVPQEQDERVVGTARP